MAKTVVVIALVLASALGSAQDRRELNLRGDRFRPLTWEELAPDQKVMGQLEAAAKKYGFASYDDYNNVVDNISLVLGGFDPATKKYVGQEAVLKAQIAELQADKKMPAKDKKEALDELNLALKTPAPAVENKGNIDLVGKYYDKLVAALGADEN